MRTLVVGTAGHIDHGKSALVEALTGVHPDRLDEERRRGITIELGFAHCRIGDVAVSLVDVPGHERFVRTMVAGAAGIDAVLLLVAANESVMPQTREHLDICRLLAVRCGVIVVTKSDLASSAQLARVREDLADLVQGTFLEGAPVVETSVVNGNGLETLRDAIAALAQQVPGAGSAGPARVPIDRVFSVKGFGTVATGTLVSGALQTDSEIEILPGGAYARVRGLHVAGVAATTVTAPSRVAVNLGGVDVQDLARGMTLAAPGALPLTRCLDAVVDVLPGGIGVRHGGRVRWLQGTTDANPRLSIMATLAPGAADWQPAAPGQRDVVTPPGGRALVRLRFGSPVATTRGDRFVLRLPAPAGTMGGGVVLDPLAPVRGVRRPGTAAAVLRLLDASVTEAALEWLTAAGIGGLEVEHLARRLGVSAADVLQVVSSGAVVQAGARLVTREAVLREAEDVRRRVEAFHAAHPSESGMAREEVRGSTPPDIFELVLREAGIAGSDRLALAGFTPVVAADAQGLDARVHTRLREGGLQPPIVSVLAEQLGQPAPAVLQALHVEARAGRVVKVGDLWFDAEALATLAAHVRAQGTGHTFDVAAMKAGLGVSRKFAIPLLEYLDRQRVTRRVGDRRVVL
ncbi:MAG: selenocysteine-specific translation elongation factor, partial [Vicinamibacterales bacterium]